jgi:hypothetical protein
MNGYPHPFLLTSLNSIINNGYNNFEILIGLDGPAPWVLSYIEWWRNANQVPNECLRIFIFDLSKTWGNRQRNDMLLKANGDVICFLDQDDCFRKNALSTIATYASAHLGHPLIFRMAVYMFGNHSQPTLEPSILWNEGRKEIAHAAVGGHMIVVPNKKELLSVWPEDKYEADLHFITNTCKNFEVLGLSPIWVDFILSDVRPWAQFYNEFINLFISKEDKSSQNLR